MNLFMTICKFLRNEYDRTAFKERMILVKEQADSMLDAEVHAGQMAGIICQERELQRGKGLVYTYYLKCILLRSIMIIRHKSLQKVKS